MNKLKLLIHYLIKAKNDILTPLIYAVNNKNNSTQLNEYYFVFDKRKLLSGGSYEYCFDDNGVPIVKGHVSDTDGNYFYQPQAIGQFSLAVFHDYLKSGDTRELNLFLNLADWFRYSYKENQGIPYWESTVNRVKNVYGKDRKGQVISSMSQSRAISVLLRAFQQTSNEDYIELAEKALLAYKNTPEKGGFLDINNEGDIFFEEASQPRILNHLIFSLFGLYDYCRIRRFETKYYKLFKNSVSSILKHIHEYDNGWWSLYDNFYINGTRRINPCTRHYHNIHIQQLKVLYLITGNSLFEEYCQEWLKCDKSIINRIKMLLHKVKTVKQMGRI